jgi:pimeloyl-ACP methyl ester carboxylesterase
MLPYWAWIIIAVGIVLFLAFAVWLFIGIKFFKIACDRRLTKKGKDRQPFVSPDGKYTLTYNWDWLNAQKFEEVKITALDKTILHGHLLRNPKADHRYLISFHGYRGEWQELSRPVSYVYDKLGFSVLMIEERGHDESGYPIITFGDRECYDVGEWVKFILLLDKDAQIAIYGLSMGAATVMMSLDKGLPKNVRCAVADCGFSSIKQQMNDTIKNWFHLPPHFIVAAAQFVAWFHGSISTAAQP